MRIDQMTVIDSNRPNRVAESEISYMQFTEF